MNKPDKSSVYVLGAPGGMIKVGVAADVRRRMASLQTASPTRLTLQHQMEVSSELCRKVERQAHWLLRESHMSGEWFMTTNDIAVAAVEQAMVDVLEGRASLGRAPGGPGRPQLNVKQTMVRLTDEARQRIEALVGPNRMAVFIREAVDAELDRREAADRERPKQS